MIQSAENKVLKINGNILQRKTRTLSYRVKGDYFPNDYYSTVGVQNTRQLFVFQSSKPNSVVVSYGDGVVQEYDFIEESTGVWNFGWRGIDCYFTPTKQVYDPVVHAYTDGNSGIRTVSFEFLDIEYIYYNPIQFNRISKTPIEWIYTNIENIYMRLTGDVEDLPIISNKTKNISVGESVFKNTLPKIPDQWFEAKNVDTIDFRAGFDLSDNIASNFFKLNQWTKLKTANFNGCLITEIPFETIRDLHATLESLDFQANKLTAIPAMPSLPKLFKLDLYGNNTITSTVIPNWNNLPKLQRILWNFLTSTVRLDYSTIPNNWAGLFSLVLIDAFTKDNSHFDEFINALYTLVTNGASITNGGAAAPYPNRFRNITWGKVALSFTGAKTAPTGYVQGVSNGTPTTVGQKAYVLQNQYNHTITHGTPI